MNIKEMHIGVNLKVQQIASNINDNLLPQEIDYFLNEAIDEIVDQEYSLIKTESRDIQSQYVSDRIRTLVTTVDITNLSAVDYLPNSKEGQLPNNYRYYIFSRTEKNDKWVNNRKLEPKAIKSYIETATNIPIFREFPIIIEGDKIIVISDTREDSDLITKLKLTYIQEPVRVKYPDTDCNLPTQVHKDVVDLGTAKILQSLNVGQQE